MSEKKNHKSPLDNPELKKNIFQVPDGYFDQFSADLQSRLSHKGAGEVEQSEHLKKSVFEAPEGYFDNLEERIKARVAEEGSLLSKEEKLRVPPFEAPEGYFDGLEEKLQQRLAGEADEETTRVIPLYQRNWFRLAVAAVLVLGFFLLKPTDPPPVIESLSDETLLAYLSESELGTDLDLMASLDGFDSVIDEILEEETADYDFDLGLNPELDYEFEYLEQ